jgi:quinol monooxygenase YgiN
MIVVVAKLKVQDGKAEMMRKLAGALAEASRREAGNISYTCTQDALEPDAWVYLEEWQTADALDAHFKTPHFTAAAAGFGELLAGAPAVKVYEVASARDLRVG